MLRPDMMWHPEEWRGWVEIALLFLGVYGIIWMIRGARAQIYLLSLVLCLVGLVVGVRVMRLEVLGWLLENFFMVSVVAVMVAFQPELRRSLSELSSHHVFSLARKEESELIDQFVEVMVQLSHRRFGALIALRQGMDLSDFEESGVLLDAKFSPELVLTVFHPKTPLHDGGLIIDDDRLTAAACIFPLSQRELKDRSLGLRHRAALGFCEETDAIVLVVSEETGQFSLCHKNTLEHNLDTPVLRRRLKELITGKPVKPPPSPAAEKTAFNHFEI